MAGAVTWKVGGAAGDFLPPVQKRDLNVAMGLIVADAIYSSPYLVYGAARASEYEAVTWEQAVDLAAKMVGVDPRKIETMRANLGHTPTRSFSTADIPEDPEEAIIYGLRMGLGLRGAAALQTEIDYPDVASAWLAVDGAGAGDQHLGQKMMRAKYLYDMAIKGDARLEESRRRDEELGGWEPAGDPEDRSRKWNWYRENVVVLDNPNQPRINELLEEVGHGQKEPQAKAG